MTPIIRKSFKNAALALGLLGAPLALSGVQLIVPSVAHAQGAPTLAEMKETLRGYGEFVSHAKYGEVWKPTVTPRGWHPYPACDWVFTKDYGWYFNDKTPWGAIVHHYGRWIHTASDGWLWVPGTEFSPGWVVWRTSAEWVGWAPTPPDLELTPAALEEFNDDKLWTFMDARKFGSTCEGGPTVAQYGDIYRSTTFVTDIRFVGGIGVFVLPPAIIGPIVNINIGVFAPWSVNFIGSWVWNWTNIFNDVDINITVNTCTPNDPPTPGRTPNDQFPGKPLIKKIDDTPPPPPPGFGPRQPRTPNVQPTGQIQPKRVREPRGTNIQDRGPSFEPRNPGRIVVERRTPDRDFEPNRNRETDRFRGRNPRQVEERGPNGRRGGGQDFDRGQISRGDRGPRGGQDFDRGFSPNRNPSLRERASRFEGGAQSRFTADRAEGRRGDHGRQGFNRFD